MEKRLKLTIIEGGDHFSLFHTGLRTFISCFIKYAPKNFDIDIIGISSDLNNRPLYEKIYGETGGRQFSFTPVYYKKNERMRSLIDVIRFSQRIKKLNLISDAVIFNQLGPAFMLRNMPTKKMLIIHSDVQKMVCFGSNKYRLVGIFPRLYFSAERETYKYMRIVGSTSKSTVDFYKTVYPEEKEKFFLISHFIDPDIFYPLVEGKIFLRKKLSTITGNIPLHSKWLLFVGRLAEEKAPIRLIDTFIECYNKDKNSYLFVIGGGNEERVVSVLKEYIKKNGVEKNVLLLGIHTQEKIAQFYRSADVFLLTSDFEGGPFVVLEALACGLPVVTTNVGQVKDFVKSNFSGEIINEFNHQNLAHGVEKVLKNPHVYLSKNCIECARNYTADIVYKPFYELCLVKS